MGGIGRALVLHLGARGRALVLYSGARSPARLRAHTQMSGALWGCLRGGIVDAYAMDVGVAVRLTILSATRVGARCGLAGTRF